MLLLALGIPDKRVVELVGLADRTVRGLRKQVKACQSPGDVGALLTIKKPQKTRSKAQGLEDQTFEELEKHHIRTRKEAAAIIQEVFGIELSVWAVGRLLKKGFQKAKNRISARQSRPCKTKYVLPSGPSAPDEKGRGRQGCTFVCRCLAFCDGL